MNKRKACQICTVYLLCKKRIIENKASICYGSHSTWVGSKGVHTPPRWGAPCWWGSAVMRTVAFVCNHVHIRQAEKSHEWSCKPDKVFIITTSDILAYKPWRSWVYMCTSDKRNLGVGKSIYTLSKRGLSNVTKVRPPAYRHIIIR